MNRKDTTYYSNLLNGFFTFNKNLCGIRNFGKKIVEKIRKKLHPAEFTVNNMASNTILVAGSSKEEREIIIEIALERIKRDDTLLVSIGGIDDSLSYREGIKWMIESFRYIEKPQSLLIVIDDIVPFIDTPEGYLVPFLLELYKEIGASYIVGTGRVSAEYLSRDIRCLFSTIVSSKLVYEIQSKLLFGVKGGENLRDGEYMVKEYNRHPKRVPKSQRAGE